MLVEHSSFVLSLRLLCITTFFVIFFFFFVCCVFFLQAEDGIRDLVRSRGLGDVYKRQVQHLGPGGGHTFVIDLDLVVAAAWQQGGSEGKHGEQACLLYTSDAADERSSVDLGGRRIIKKQTDETHTTYQSADKR